MNDEPYTSLVRMAVGESGDVYPARPQIFSYNPATPVMYSQWWE